MYEPIQEEQNHSRIVNKIFYGIVSVVSFGIIIWSIVSIWNYYNGIS